MIDSHCHLADAAFLDDRDDVIDRARAAGLDHALCIVDPLEPEEAIRAEAACRRWPALRLALGVHPHRAAAFATRPELAAEEVRGLLRHDAGVRALGEVGLDYHYDFSPAAVQRSVFASQVALAAELSVPLVIHTREADADTVAILRSEGRGVVSGVFHCFSGDAALARAALDLGFMISFSGIVTFPKAGVIHEVARVVPDDRLLVETDCPYLAPVPVRGRRNEPAWVIHVAARLAALRGTSVDVVSTLVTANFQRLFRP